MEKYRSEKFKTRKNVKKTRCVLRPVQCGGIGKGASGIPECKCRSSTALYARLREGRDDRRVTGATTREAQRYKIESWR